MAESELARNITKLIKATDKLIRDTRKNVESLVEAAKKLEKKDEEEKGK